MKATLTVFSKWKKSKEEESPASKAIVIPRITVNKEDATTFISVRQGKQK
jgi:hypothetical protein